MEGPIVSQKVVIQHLKMYTLSNFTMKNLFLLHFGHENWLEGRRQAELPAILAANAGVSAGQLCALNQRSINHIYASNALWKPNLLSSTLLLQVKAIADQCPLDGGFAVYEARSLYRRFVPSAMWDEYSGCSSLRPEGRSMLDEEVVLPFSLVPNPADDVLLLISSGESKRVRLDLYSITGERILSEWMMSDTSGQVLNVSNLPSGMYLYRILHQGEAVQSGKVVISH